MSDVPANKEIKPDSPESSDEQSPLSEDQHPVTAEEEARTPGDGTADEAEAGKGTGDAATPADPFALDDAAKEPGENPEGAAEEGEQPPLSEEPHSVTDKEEAHKPGEPDDGAVGDALPQEDGDDASTPDKAPPAGEEEQGTGEDGTAEETDGDDEGAAEEDDDNVEDEEAEDEEDRPMTLRDHFRELRKRFFYAFLCAVAGFSVCYPFAKEISEVLLQPLILAMPKGTSFIYTTPAEAFFTELKIAFVAGIFVTSPLIFYQIWAFVAPGLYKEEKMYVLPVSFFSAAFFIGGGLFCYLVVFPLAFAFFMSYSTGFLQAMLAISSTLSFVLQLLLAFGLVFELPLFVFFLARLGIVTADMMRKFRRYAILVMVIVAAILTPPDVMSQTLMAGPLLILYELSIFIAALFGKKKAVAEEQDEEEREQATEPAS